MPKNIGQVAMDAILAGASDDEALAAVLEAFPDAATKLNSIKWYRSKLRKDVKEGKREAGKEGAPQRRMGGLVRESGPMSDELKLELKRNIIGWRHRMLKRYVGNVLARKGLERMLFFEDHPVSEVFK